MLKQTIISLIPPALLKQTQIRRFKKVDGTYQDALKLCTKDAYEEKELMEVIVKKTKRYVANLENKTIQLSDTNVFCLFSLINPIIESNKKEINVLDFGGSCGLHYFQARTILSKSLKLNWIVVETPAMVEHAKELESDELRFCASLQEAQQKFENIDIIITSGTLQCVDDPHKYLNELLNCNAKWILFTRLGLNQIDRDVIIVFKTSLAKNGVGELPEGYEDREVRYPFTFHSEKRFIEAIEKKYKIVSKFDDKTGSFPIVDEEITGYGLLCLNKNHIDQ